MAGDLAAGGEPDLVVGRDVLERLLELPDAVWLADQVERARAIDVPTLVLCGTEDRITPPALSEELAALIPGAKLELIERAGHLANAEQPALFNAAIDSFLSATAQKTAQ